MIINNHYKTINLTKKTVHVLLLTLCIGALLYCFVLLSVIFSVIERKQNMLSIRDLSSELSSLEIRYSNEISSINDTRLADMSFKKVNNSNFAVRKTDIASYTVLYAR